MKKRSKPRNFTLTPKRVAALKLIRKTPGVYVGHIAQELLAGDRARRGLWSQAATRMGAGYCITLKEQGLVTIDTFVDCGYGRVTLTAKGEEVLRDHEVAANTLDAVLARSIDA